MEDIIKKYLGRMNDPTSSAFLKGPCGDSMEFYLVIKDNTIKEIKYYTDGCNETKTCAAMTAHLVNGKTLEQALCLSAGEVMQNVKALPYEHLHCSILAVSTLYRALADHLLKD
ncbi:MAG: iron-sulfur cluster assembly scaffold protein [Candidatus Omnitrophica bacterium]|nr:iron-sulfur cluster assembly scaffold protein [Candidatus Omnitrophota bacterium]